MHQLIPHDALNHCLLLFEQGEDVVPRFLEAFADRFPGTDANPETWAMLGQPRPCVFGPLAWQRWRWHILLDLRGMPPQVDSIMAQAQMSELAQQAVDRHQAAAMLFLTDGPETASPAEQDRALA